MAPAPAGAAQKACIDPATGRLVSPDERPECRTGPGAARAEAEATAPTAEEPLPQGGAKLDLEGQLQQDKDAAPVTPGGRIAILDPQTGRLMTGEAAALMRQRQDMRSALQDFEREMQNLVTRSQDVSGLEEQELQSGAVKLDLEGRFQSPLVARVTPTGGIAIRHEPAAGR